MFILFSTIVANFVEIVYSSKLPMLVNEDMMQTFLNYQYSFTTQYLSTIKQSLVVDLYARKMVLVCNGNSDWYQASKRH